MHVIRVAPLAALPNTVPQILDYFWPTPLSEGNLVKMTIGRRSVTGLVLECLDLEHAKMAIKKSSFGLKKITGVIAATSQVTENQIALSRWMSRQYCVPLGLCLKTILPAWIGKKSHLLQIAPEKSKEKRLSSVPRLILSEPETALDEVTRIIKSSSEPVLFLLPDIELSKKMAQELREFEPLLVNGELGVKSHSAAYRSILENKPRLIVGTRIAMFLPFIKLGNIIVEDPLHEAYKSDMSPRYASADIARELAGLFNAKLTFLSPAKSTVNHYLIKKEVLLLSDHKPYWPRIVECDMTIERQHNASILSRPVQEAVLDAYEHKRSLLLFSPRRSYASQVSCERCNAPVRCNTCNIPMRLNRHANENMLICYHCTAFTQVPKQCPSCHGGRLKATGLAGNQKIAEAANVCLDRYGHNKLDMPILDTDLVRSEQEAREVLAKFEKMDRPIIVATQKIFNYRYWMRFDQVAVIQADALVYNPDYRTQERLIYQLEKLADFKPETMYVQAWDRSGALAHVAGRTWDEFYEQELQERKAMTWPPFVRIARLTFSHHNEQSALRSSRISADRLRRAAEDLKFSKQISILGPTPALVERAGGRWTQHLVIKTSLPPDKFNALLAHSEPGGVIDMDPRSIT